MSILFSSTVNVPLPTQPSSQNPEVFTELLTVYRAIRQLHFQIGSLAISLPGDVSGVADADMLEYYTHTSGAVIKLIAEVDIAANRFVTAKLVGSDVLANLPATLLGVIGYTYTGALAGQTCRIYTQPALLDGLSGLTPGEFYSVNSSGELFLPTGMPTNSIGIALSSTVLRLKTPPYF